MKIMKKVSVVEAFSCPLDKLDVVEKAREVARRNGMSFSAYVVDLLEREYQKKVEPQVGPLNLPRQQVTESGMNTNTLDAFMPYSDLAKRVSEIDDKEKLYVLKKNGHVIETIASTKLKRIAYQN